MFGNKVRYQQFIQFFSLPTMMAHFFYFNIQSLTTVIIFFLLVYSFCLPSLDFLLEILLEILIQAFARVAHFFYFSGTRSYSFNNERLNLSFILLYQV